MPKRDSTVSLNLRVLGYREGNSWAAHCLETDLVGYGKTFDAALKALIELTEMQASFAVQWKQRSLLDHPAPPAIWQTYERLAQDWLRNLRPTTLSTADRTIGYMPLPRSVTQGRPAWSVA